LSLYSSVGRQLRGDFAGRQLRGVSIGRQLRGDSVGRHLRGDSLIDSYFSTRQLVFILGRHQNLATQLVVVLG
jgi:hypothetical protein